MRNNMVNMDDLSIPIIASEWTLRGDDRYLVLFRCDEEGIRHIVLDLLSATIIPLVNGQRTLKDIRKMVMWLHDIPNAKESSRLVDTVFNGLNQYDRIIVDQGVDTSCSNIFGTAAYVAKLSEYDCKPRRLSQPITLTLAFTNNCPGTDCLYCYSERRSLSSETLLTQHEWKKIIDEAVGLSIKHVELAGGDPLATKQSRELVLYLLEKGLLFFLSTKAPIDKSFAKKLMNLGFAEPRHNLRRRLQLSIDSSDAAEAALLSGCHDILDRTVRSLRNLIEVGINPRIKAVITRHNVASVAKTLEYFMNLGVKDFQFVFYSRSYYRHDDSLFVPDDEKIRLSHEFTRLEEGLSDDISVEFQKEYGKFDPLKRKTEDEWVKRNRCSGGFTTFCIHPNGDISLCEQLPQTNDFIFGNIRGKTIVDAWGHNSIPKFLFANRESFRGTVCFDCVDFEQCHFDMGYCYREAFFHYGTLFEAPPDCPYQLKPAKRI